MATEKNIINNSHNENSIITTGMFKSESLSNIIKNKYIVLLNFTKLLYTIVICTRFVLSSAPPNSEYRVYLVVEDAKYYHKDKKEELKSNLLFKTSCCMLYYNNKIQDNFEKFENYDDYYKKTLGYVKDVILNFKEKAGSQSDLTPFFEKIEKFFDNIQHIQIKVCGNEIINFFKLFCWEFSNFFYNGIYPKEYIDLCNFVLLAIESINILNNICYERANYNFYPFEDFLKLELEDKNSVENINTNYIYNLNGLISTYSVLLIEDRINYLEFAEVIHKIFKRIHEFIDKNKDNLVENITVCFILTRNTKLDILKKENLISDIVFFDFEDYLEKMNKSIEKNPKNLQKETQGIIEDIKKLSYNITLLTMKIKMEKDKKETKIQSLLLKNHDADKTNVARKEGNTSKDVGKDSLNSSSLYKKEKKKKSMQKKKIYIYRI